MGDTRRAEHLSSQFKNRTLKAIALYGFDKCGNCVHRIKCGEEILASGGKQRPLHFIITSMMEGCPKTKFNSIGFIPKEMSGFLSSNCAHCDKLQICSGYIAQHVGMDSPEGKEKVHTTVVKCLNCKDLDNCIHYFMTQLNISKVSLMKHAFLIKFRHCSEEKRQTVSLDLPPDVKGANVGGTVKQGEKPKD